jgi:hypothetical protein
VRFNDLGLSNEATWCPPACYIQIVLEISTHKNHLASCVVPRGYKPLFPLFPDTNFSM